MRKFLAAIALFLTGAVAYAQMDGPAIQSRLLPPGFSFFGVVANTVNVLQSLPYTIQPSDCSKTVVVASTVGSGTITFPTSPYTGFPTACAVMIVNQNSIAAVQLSGFPSVTRPRLYSNDFVVVRLINGVATTDQNIRYHPATGLTLYIRPDGSDSNPGTANSASGAFLTANACMNEIANNIDMNNQTVGCTHTCSAPPCNITSNSQFVSLTGGTTFVGGAPFYHGDDCSSGTRVKLNPGSATTADIQITLEVAAVPINICGFEFAGGANVSYGIYCGGNCSVDLIGGQFQCDAMSATAATGFPAGACLQANSTGHIYINANFAVTGSMGAVFSYTNGAYIEVGSAVTGTISGSLTWTNGFAYAAIGGGSAALGSITFAGAGAGTASAGPGCNIARGASLNINGSGAGYFPGTANCSVAGGGVSDAAGMRASIF